MVRPDGYVGVRAEFGDNDSVGAYLTSIFEHDTVEQLAAADRSPIGIAKVVARRGCHQPML